MDWEELRGFRDERLTLLDRYQLVICWELLTESQKTDLRNYRTALLDLPQNYDTPDEAYTNLPTKPLWMT
mgnify:CR=1 FL=1|tara:strand:- start:478 stop:687 length:210 start_codon:yes stop_codon:yes gene_type:complete